MARTKANILTSLVTGRFYVPKNTDIGELFRKYVNTPLDVEKLQKEFPILCRETESGYTTEERDGGYDGYNQEYTTSTFFHPTSQDGGGEVRIDWQTQLLSLPTERGKIAFREIDPKLIEYVGKEIEKGPLDSRFSLKVMPFFSIGYFEGRAFESGVAYEGTAIAPQEDSWIKYIGERHYEGWYGWTDDLSFESIRRGKEEKKYPLVILLSKSSSDLDNLEKRLRLNP